MKHFSFSSYGNADSETDTSPSSPPFSPRACISADAVIHMGSTNSPPPKPKRYGWANPYHTGVTARPHLFRLSFGLIIVLGTLFLFAFYYTLAHDRPTAPPTPATAVQADTPCEDAECSGALAVAEPGARKNVQRLCPQGTVLAECECDVKGAAIGTGKENGNGMSNGARVVARASLAKRLCVCDFTRDDPLAARTDAGTATWRMRSKCV